MDGQVGCFQLGAIISKADSERPSTSLHSGLMLLFLLGKYLRAEW
jgi:hypothetical protein